MTTRSITTVIQCQLEEKEKKLQKELVKGSKDRAATQEKLREATEAKTQAQVDGKSDYVYNKSYPTFFVLVSEIVLENISAKPRIVKRGLINISGAWNEMGKKCSILAGAQKVCVLFSSHVGPYINSLFLIAFRNWHC